MTSNSNISIAEEINLFAKHLESLRISITPSMTILEEAHRKRREDLQAFAQKNCKEIVVNNENLIHIPQEHYKEWKRIKFKHERLAIAQGLLSRSLFVSLVSQYDAFLGRLLRALFLLKPETLNPSKKEFTFSEISKFNHFDDFKNHVVNKEVESVLRDSHADQFEFMQKRFSVNLLSDLKIWPIFIELTERRNLFVHTDGVVSQQYLDNCKKHNVSLSAEIKEGAILQVSPEYFLSAYNCLYEIGVKLAHVLWRKLLPKNIDSADESFNHTSFDLLEREEYDLACALMDFACEDFDLSNEYNHLVLTVNRAQAHKWAGRDSECKKIMSSCDWSAKGDQFQLANAVLNEQWEDCIKFIRRIGSNGSIQKIWYRDWPLFKELRKREEFQAVYKEVFQEDFQVYIQNPNLEQTKSIAKVN